ALLRVRRVALEARVEGAEGVAAARRGAWSMRRLNWFGFWTLLGLVSGVQLFFADQRLALHPNAWWQALATTLPAWYLWGLLSLVVAWLGRRFRVDRANFGRHFFIHLCASLEIGRASCRERVWWS